MNSPQLSSHPIFITDPTDVDFALSRIGVDRTILLNAAEEGERARQNCTDNHPVSAGGTEFYLQTVRALRDQLLPDWSKKCDRGSELTISPDGKYAIVVASGDENVGTTTPPRTKCRKGRQMRRAASRNVASLNQFDLFPLTRADAAAVVAERERNPSLLTFVLLAHRTDEEVIVELSLVTGMDDNGYPDEWGVRYLVGSLPLHGAPVVDKRADDAADDDDDFNVPVKRRNA